MKDTEIELVVRLPKGAYDVLCSTGVDWIGAEHILDAVSKGKILPEGHGELVEKNFIIRSKITSNNNGISDRTKGWNEACQAIFENAPTIIEADKENQNDD